MDTTKSTPTTADLRRVQVCTVVCEAPTRESAIPSRRAGRAGRGRAVLPDFASDWNDRRDDHIEMLQQIHDGLDTSVLEWDTRMACAHLGQVANTTMWTIGTGSTVAGLSLPVWQLQVVPDL